MDFESTRDIEAKRNERRQAREALLQQAKREFEKAERKAAEIKSRGEDRWILPSLSDKIDKEAKELADKVKKHKVKKKKKHAKRKDRQADSGSENSEEEQWVEKPKAFSSSSAVKPAVIDAGTAGVLPNDNVPSSGAIKRDDWMMLDTNLIPTVSRQQLRDQIQRDKQQYADMNRQAADPGLNERELNPYWKSGGTGLPQEQGEDKPKPKHSLSFLQQAYERCERLAIDSGRDLSEVAAERYGSLESLEIMIMEAEREEELARRSVRNRSSRSPSPDRFNERKSHRRRSPRPQHERSSVKSQSDAKLRRSGSCGRDRSRSRSRSRSPKSRFLKPGSFEQRSEKSSRRFLKPDDHADNKRDADTKSVRREITTSNSTWRKPPHKTADVAVPEPTLIKKIPKPNTDTEIVRPTTQSTSSAESEDSDSSGAAPVATKPVLLSEAEMNMLAAKILKAELMGDTNTANQLKAKLDDAREAAKTAPKSAVSKDSTIHKVVVLAKADKYGNMRPVVSAERHKPSDGERKKKGKPTTHDKSGLRERYFADDDKYNLKALVNAERFTTAEDQHAMFSDLASRSSSAKADDDYQIDDIMLDRAHRRHDETREATKQRSQAESQSRHLTKTLDNCRLCFENASKHLIIAVAKKTYLSLPAEQSLVEGQCKIVPLHHCISSTVTDEDVWNEVQEFRRSLVEMFRAQGQDCVFLECSKDLRRQPHMSIDCVPLDPEIGDLAPIYFKKAIQESDKEWSQNKKLIDLSKKDVRHSVPKGFPYFSVDFGLQGGFAHVIEDEAIFPVYFGKEILGGMLDLEPRLWRKQHHESFEEQRKKVLKFASMWKSFDWTSKSSLTAGGCQNQLAAVADTSKPITLGVDSQSSALDDDTVTRDDDTVTKMDTVE